MIEIRCIKPDEWLAAKQVVYRVAHGLFARGRDLDTFIAQHEAIHELKDMDDIQGNYFDNGGTFLVMIDDEKMICTGAIRHLENEVCELKRLWLLSEYQGKRLGYRMLQELLTFAREKDFKRIRLETDPNVQSRALEFYKQVGFYEIDSYTNRGDEAAMEMLL